MPTAPTSTRATAMRSSTRSTRSATRASRAVTFAYASKDPADARTRYTGGMQVASALRLDQIQMLGPGNELVRSYAFTYALGPTTSRTLLTQLEECAGD